MLVSRIEGLEIMEEILRLYRELHGLLGKNNLVEEFFQRIHSTVQEVIDQIPDETGIVIRPAGAEAEKTLELYDFSEKNIIGIVDKKERRDGFCGYPCFTMDSLPAKTCGCVLILSFLYRQAIKEELETLHIPYIDLYDELEKRGFPLQLPHNTCETNIQAVVNYFYLRYLRSEAGPQRESALRELLQIAVECKDFTLISNIYQDCGGEKGEFPILKTVWRESKRLLNSIRDKLQERKQKDIFLFWTDAVPYNILHWLPETMKLSKQGIFFQRAYTQTPFTGSTMSAIFSNVLPINDFPQNQKKIDSGNSPLIQFMENEGYKVRLIAGAANIPMGKDHLFDEDHYLSSCNMKWWRGIIDLLQSPEPCFYMFHFMESHPPCFSPFFEEPALFLDLAPRAKQEAQVKATFEYLDQCLSLYRKLLGNKTQVYFSDHGKHMWADENWSESLLHPYCFAVGENIPEMAVTRFFPLGNFEKFARWLVDPTRFPLDDVCTDEVIFQDTDFFNPRMIDQFIQRDQARKGIAYRGVLTYDYKYAINALGEEFFYQMQQDGREELIPLEDPALRTELQAKSGTEFLDIDRYDEFRYARKLYEFLKSKEEQPSH